MVNNTRFYEKNPTHSTAASAPTFGQPTIGVSLARHPAVFISSHNAPLKTNNDFKGDNSTTHMTRSR